MNNKAESLLSQSFEDLIPSFNLNKTLKDILISNKFKINEKIKKEFSEYINNFNKC